jgi:protein-tyrosine phosphatase
VTTPHVPRHLDWPGLANVRDLGGLPTHDGATVRDGALIRADSLTHLDEEAVGLVERAGVSRIVDLRRPAESDQVHPFADDETYVNLPVEDPADRKDFGDTMLSIYLALLDARPDLFAAAVGAIADAPPGAVVVHCAAGKDRTGLVVGMALTLVGVSPELVAADYALTESRLAHLVEGYLDRLPDQSRREVVREQSATPAATMRAVLDHLERTYGGAEAYLRTGGLTGAQVTALRARLVEAGAVGAGE